MALLTPSLPSQKSLNVSISLIALSAGIALLYFGRSFFVTLIISAIFAFILDPAVMLVMKLRLPRPAATGIVIGIACLGVYLLGAIVWTELATFSEDLPTYTSRLNEIIDKTSTELDSFEKRSVNVFVPKILREQEVQIQQKPQEAMKARRRKAGLPIVPEPVIAPAIQEVRIRADSKPVITVVYSYLSSYFHALLMASFVPFLVYFMLSWRDRFGRSVLRIFHSEERYAVGKSWVGIAESTRGYVLGNFFIWLILSTASAAAFFLLGVPYWPVIGPVSGFFSLVPYIGLPLAIGPPVLSAVAIPNRFKIILLVVLITTVLHLIATNVLYAKIVGRRVHLNPLIVTVALLFWGAVWGGFGLVLAIPITAAIKAVCDNVKELEPYGRLLGD